MGTTPNYGWPYPELANAPDGPAQIKNLALAIDTSLKTTVFNPVNIAFATGWDNAGYTPYAKLVGSTVFLRLAFRRTGASLAAANQYGALAASSYPLVLTINELGLRPTATLDFICVPSVTQPGSIRIAPDGSLNLMTFVPNQVFALNMSAAVAATYLIG